MKPGALTIQKELMRHTSIPTTMNIQGKAMTESKRQAHSKVVEMVLNTGKLEKNAGCCHWEFVARSEIRVT
jgi:hypothetical protein